MLSTLNLSTNRIKTSGCPRNVNIGCVMESKHDAVFLSILKDERNVANFLEAFFGFMYRCTDFYVESSPQQKLGFPSGVAEQLVLTILRKWKKNYENSKLIQSDSEPVTAIPSVDREIEIETSNDDSDQPSEGYETPVQPSDSYNGAVRDKYTWSQTITDLDILVNVPPYITKAKDLTVDIKTSRINICARKKILEQHDNSVEYPTTSEDLAILFDGELSFKTQKEESVWYLVPGKHVNIHLEKASERWWEALVKGEPCIELSKIDCSRHIDELGMNEQMKVQELMWNHQQKLLGKPTSDRIRMEEMLKKAWNVEGSPFKGSEYDPSVLQFN